MSTVEVLDIVDEVLDAEVLDVDDEALTNVGNLSGTEDIVFDIEDLVLDNIEDVVLDIEDLVFDVKDEVLDVEDDALEVDILEDKPLGLEDVVLDRGRCPR